MCQILANLKDRWSNFHLEYFESFKAVPDTSECEVEEVFPTSINSEYASKVKFSSKTWEAIVIVPQVSILEIKKVMCYWNKRLQVDKGIQIVLILPIDQWFSWNQWET